MEKKIKILHILPSLTKAGAEKVCYDILINLDQDKFISQLLLFKDNGEGIEWKKSLEEKNIKVYSLTKKYLIDINNFWQIFKIIKNSKPDIVHTHLGADVYGKIAAFFNSIKIIISTEHNINISERKIITWCKKITNSISKKMFAVSQAVKEDAISRYKTKADKYTIIYNGIDTDHFSSKDRELDKKKETITIGALGRLNKQKGFSILLEAVEKIKNKNFKILIAGKGELEIPLKQRINKLGLSNKVELVGQVDAKEFLEQIDIFVFPSLWEGLGLSVLEAASMKKLIIASETGGVKEIITSESGILFKPGDENDLSDKINYAISNFQSEEVKRKIEKANEIAKNRFSLNKMIFNYSVWYEKLYYHQ